MLATSSEYLRSYLCFASLWSPYAPVYLSLIFCQFSRTNFAPVSNQKGYLYKLKSIDKANKRISFLRWQQRLT